MPFVIDQTDYAANRFSEISRGYREGQRQTERDAREDRALTMQEDRYRRASELDERELDLKAQTLATEQQGDQVRTAGTLQQYESVLARLSPQDNAVLGAAIRAGDWTTVGKFLKDPVRLERPFP